MQDSLKTFLSKLPPFNVLPENELQKVQESLSKQSYPSGSTLFVQNQTLLNHVYILFSGKLEKYFQDQDHKNLSEVMENRDIYGGLSILFNRGLSIRTVTTLEDSVLYSLPKEYFLDLCTKYPEFIQYFTEQFCDQMLQQPYMSLMNRGAPSEEISVSPGFLNLSLRNVFSQDFVSCNEYLSIQEAARIMSRKKKSCIVIMNALGQSVGLLTDNDLRKKVVSQNYPVHYPVKDIASRPLITLPAQAQVFEATLQMMKNGIKHLVITDDWDNIQGIATEQDLLLAQGKSPVYLMREIQLAESVQELKARHKQLPGMIKSLLDSGAKAAHLNRIITEISDAILKKIIGFALQETDEPPTSFAFMILGSEGRKEQTLKTDQDNAIVYQDVSPEKKEQVQAYFLHLGDKICTWLDEVGYSFCEFEVMARNPKWCQPLSQWQTYFWDWIHKVEPADLLHSSIFFDFRLGYGDKRLIQDLRNYLFKTLSNWKGFFRHFAENALYFKPPLDFFGSLVLKTQGNKKNTLDIKQPMQLLVDFARVYALKYGIEDTNTLDRLEKLRQLGVLEQQDHDELVHAYSYMMLIRLSHQAEILAGEEGVADNLIQPKRLTYIDRQSLKEAFKRIKTAQGKMRMDLTQDIGI